MKNVLVIGGGSWGTCLAKLLVENGSNVYLWEHSEKNRDIMKKERKNPIFLPEVKLPEELKIIDDYCEVLSDEQKYGRIDVVLLATPTQFLRTVLKRLKNCLIYNIILVNVAKGIEISSKKRISEVVAEELGNKEYSYVLLAGPTHAEEVAIKLPSAILAVSTDENAAIQVQKLFSNNYFRVYTGTDLTGAELGGALKNCLAIAAGMSDGLGFGDNSKAALITRGINEILEISKYYDVNPKTFMGLSGLGDIIVKGEKIEDITANMNMVSEGAETIKALYAIIKEQKINAPVFSALYEVIYQGKPVNELVSLFMSRNLKSEFV